MQLKKIVIHKVLLLGLCLMALLSPEEAYAYIGPGAGFAFLGSAFVFIGTLLMAVLTLAFWPLQWLWRWIRNKGISKDARTRRVVILGLDGLDPKLLRKYMKEGMLPSFSALSEEGSFRELATTIPSISPVAWSSFQTGVNPGAHNIFDFLTRDKRTYLPKLSSTDTVGSEKSLSFGKFSIPLGKSRVLLKRRSKPFWNILGDHGVFCNVLRVPITYPPEKFKGNILAAMCAPDLKGTQGTYSLFSTEKKEIGEASSTGEERHVLQRKGALLQGEILGPPDPFLRETVALKAAFTVSLRDGDERAELRVGKTKQILKLDEFSPWIEVKFKTALGSKISGICRFCLRSLTPECVMYVSPININPAKPVLPIAEPAFFATYMAKRQGLYGTLGLLEDTWALNNRALAEKNFIDQVYLMHAEREEMFFDLLEKTKEGALVCVFDASDRIQHMFWRFMDREGGEAGQESPVANAIPEMYQRMDGLLGRVRTKLSPDDVLIVMSDHGFTAFRREFNINTWLKQEGYLTLKDSNTVDTEYLQNIDWQKTSAFGVGLGCLYLNRVGRERLGIVKDSEAENLKADLITKLEQVCDPKTKARVVRKVYDTAKCYKGIYREDGPDLIIGCEPGYRVGWSSVTGQSSGDVFADNDKAWSGDHCVDPAAVPGILLVNRKFEGNGAHMIDIAPTVLDLFAVKVPEHMEGKVLF